MGKEYLVDSNAVIDFFNGKMPDKGRLMISGIVPAISIITQIEIFSNANITSAELFELKQFVNAAVIYSVDQSIAIQAINIRVKYKTKLPDALIAATSVYHDLILITRNISDFKRIAGLELINPYSI